MRFKQQSKNLETGKRGDRLGESVYTHLTPADVRDPSFSLQSPYVLEHDIDEQRRGVVFAGVEEGDALYQGVLLSGREGSDVVDGVVGHFLLKDILVSGNGF